MNKTRLLFFVEDLSVTNGPNCQLKNVTRTLLESGLFEIHIATLCDQGISDETITGIRLHCLNPRSTRLSQCLELRQMTQSISPDIIHAWGYSTHLPVAFSQLRNDNPAKLIYSYFCKPPNRLLVRRWLEELIGREPAVVTASHQSIADSLVADGFDNPIHIIPNSPTVGSPNQKDARQKLLELAGVHDDQVFLAGTTGCMEPRFRIKDLIWATDILSSVRNDVHLMIFGDGAGKAALSHFLSKTEAIDKVHFIDSREINHEDLAGLNAYWNAQLEEPNPVMMLNAMSSGVPAISVVGPETEDVILPMQSGLGTNRGARDEFARWTKFLIEQTERNKALSVQSRRHVEMQFPAQKTVDALMQLYSPTG